MFVYEFSARPLMLLEDIKTALPSQEVWWENPDAGQHHSKPPAQGMCPSGGSSPLFRSRCTLTVDKLSNAADRA
jgi:hypothetical protein